MLAAVLTSIKTGIETMPIFLVGQLHFRLQRSGNYVDTRVSKISYEFTYIGCEQLQCAPVPRNATAF